MNKLFSILLKPYRVVFTDFPESYRNRQCSGVVRDEGSQYVIYIDKGRSTDEQKRALKHELSHVFCGHLVETWRSIEETEIEAEENATRMTDETMQSLLNQAVSIDGIML